MINDFKYLQDQLEHKLNSISNEKDRTRKKIETQKSREVKKVNNIYEEQIKISTGLYDTRRTDTQNEFYRRAAGEIHNSLQLDYETLQNRSILAELPVKEREKAEKTYKLIQTMGDENKAVVEGVIGILDKSIKDALPLFSEDSTRHRNIYSFIAAGKDNCYLITPIDGGENKTLAVNLDKKLSMLLDHGEVSISSRINFQADLDLANDFAIYTITPTNPTNTKTLAKDLAKKLEELQPIDFKETNLAHRVLVVDYPILEYFKTHNREDMYTAFDEIESLRKDRREYIPISRAANLAGVSEKAIKTARTRGILKTNNFDEIGLESLEKYIFKKQGPRETLSSPVDGTQGKKRRQGLNFDSAEPELIRQEALRRLQECSNPELTSNQVINVLGYHTVAALSSAKEVMKNRKEGKKLLWDSESIKNFIQDRTPKLKSGWRNPK